MVLSCRVHVLESCDCNGHKHLDWWVVAVELQVGVRERNHDRGTCWRLERGLQQEDLQVIPLGCNVADVNEVVGEQLVDRKVESSCCDRADADDQTNHP